jgi:hypothetical protein
VRQHLLSRPVQNRGGGIKSRANGGPGARFRPCGGDRAVRMAEMDSPQSRSDILAAFVSVTCLCVVARHDHLDEKKLVAEA